ncbi:Eco57I restriction-modification methylase domain-containing protein [Anaeroselena agilis]|uniref:site-specific DNA-methyltransferase (adenine-specific) n=1 Tax=Anaeroselena agilis TaxID=3063788 RepID=A0ABU3NY90_9FIRM|nr:N-6 DNA methylase [Selenomonadales bacterium 4137-cl]
MNWKHFLAECQEVKTWLTAHGRQADRGLLTVLVAVLGGSPTTEDAAARAIGSQALTDAVLGPPVAGDAEIPDRIHAIISRWLCTLPHDAWLLGELYEKLAFGRRAQGLFYTAPQVIDFILARTAANADITADPHVKILDPACGCGNFLLRAYDLLRDKYISARGVLAEQFPDNDWSDDGIHRHIVTHNLWGADIDELAAETAAAGLLLKRPQACGGLRPNILVCDSLRRPERDAGGDRAFWSSRYDYVIGNPPYLSFGLRGAQRLDRDYEAYLRRAFSASAEYKLSYYVLFLERGIEMLVEGGKLGFILPDSFLLGRYYSKIRRYIMDHTAIETMVHIALPVFKNAAVGMSAICVLRRESDPTGRESQAVTVHHFDSKDDLKQEAAGCSYPQNYFATLPHQRFRLFSDLTVKNLIDKIDNSNEPLANFASGHTGVRSVSKQSDIIGRECAGQTWRRGLVSGSQVERYGLTYEGHWLNIDPARLYKGGWDPAVVGVRKILVRQTGYTLTACIDDNGYYHLNNLHSFVATDGDVTLDYLLMLLNSRLMSFYYHAVTMEYGRSMAQTDIDTLELLPVRIHPEASARAPELVRIMATLIRRRKEGDNGAEARSAAMDDLFNQMVYKIYELSPAEINLVEEYETRLTARRSRRRPLLGKL